MKAQDVQKLQDEHFGLIVPQSSPFFTMQVGLFGVIFLSWILLNI
jgi:hypothetical protein